MTDGTFLRATSTVLVAGTRTVAVAAPGGTGAAAAGLGDVVPMSMTNPDAEPTGTPNAERQPGTLSGPVQLGKNFVKKVRKHIDQVRNRVTPPEDIPSPGKGGIKRVAEIIHERVAKGGGREATYAGETVVAFEDGGVTYIFRSNGEFWTILGN